MSDTTKFCLWCAIFVTLTFLIFLSFYGRVQAQDDPLGVGHTHQGDVGKFYLSWMRPGLRDSRGARYSSCCGGQECRPIQEMRKHPGGSLFLPFTNPATTVPATWEILVNTPYRGNAEWIAVPDSLWEDNQPDPRESPDERGHACITYSGFVICAVRASGQ